MTPHAWCRDPSRDERVRAAEDGRDRPLPTLKECIAGVTERMSIDAGGEESSPGLRTERITLEVTHDLDARLSDWIVEVVDESLGLMESVRVVSDEEREAALPDVSDQDGDRVAIDWHGLAKVLQSERDAAIRERDELRKQVVAIKEQSHDRWRSMNNALCELSKVRSERDALQARVAELEAASGGEHKVTEGDCLATVRDEGGRAMPTGPAPGLVAKQDASGGEERAE